MKLHDNSWPPCAHEKTWVSVFRSFGRYCSEQLEKVDGDSGILQKGLQLLGRLEQSPVISAGTCDRSDHGSRPPQAKKRRIYKRGDWGCSKLCRSFRLTHCMGCSWIEPSSRASGKQIHETPATKGRRRCSFGGKLMAFTRQYGKPRPSNYFKFISAGCSSR